MKLTNFIREVWGIYYKFTALSFFVFLFCVFSFGRAFSILRINTPITPVFITEAFILLNIPVLIYKIKVLGKLPRLFLLLLMALFFLGFTYLLTGIFNKNMFALRDIPLFLYILFLPICVIHLDNLGKIKTCLAVFIISNAVGLVFGRLLLMYIYPTNDMRLLFSEAKLFNFGLYYGIASALIVSLYYHLKTGIYRLFGLIILALNAYMFITIAKSSLWLSLLVTLAFLSLLLKSKALKLLIPFAFTFIIVNLAVFSLDSIFDHAFHKGRIFEKAKSVSLFLNGVQYKYESGPALPKIVKKEGVPLKTASPNISFKKIPEPNFSESEVSSDKAKLKKVPVKESTSQSLGNIVWRFNIWKQTLKFCSDSPLLGKGFGVYPVYEILGTYQSPQRLYNNSGIVPVHNHLITLFFKMGILGLSLFLFVNFYAFIYALLYLKKCNLMFVNDLLVGLLASFVFWHVLALFFDVIDSPPTSIFLWIIMGLIFSAIEIDKNSKQMAKGR